MESSGFKMREPPRYKKDEVFEEFQNGVQDIMNKFHDRQQARRETDSDVRYEERKKKAEDWLQEQERRLL